MGRPEFNPLRDVISGAIMAATSIPQLLSYAETVGYAAHVGLSTAGAPLLAFGLVTGSPFLNAGVTSITALMTKADLNGEAYVAHYGHDAYIELVAAYSLYIGLASVLLAVVGFGTLAQRVPQPVRTGFKWGCAVGVLVSAVPNGLFARGSKELRAHLAETTWLNSHVDTVKTMFPAATGAVTVTNFFFGLASPHLWAIVPTLLFLICTLVVVQGKHYLPKSLPPGTEVILATAGATLFSIYSTNYPGAIVGEIPVTDAGMTIPWINLKIPVSFINVGNLITQVPLVERCFGGSVIMMMISATLFVAVNFLSIMGILSGFEADDDIAWSAPRELMAQGVACGVAASVGSAPVSGSMSRSLVSRMTGATSQLACIVTALFWIYLLPYMSIMSATPKAALSAVIVSAVLKGVFRPTGLMKLKGLDFYIGWGSALATALTSPTIGFGIGIALYFVLRLFRGMDKKKIN